jgi:hypothetical protein
MDLKELEYFTCHPLAPFEMDESVEVFIPADIFSGAAPGGEIKRAWLA